jgi:two-component sensor histidine kinase/AmiR/NasT family two-component response regulator
MKKARILVVEDQQLIALEIRDRLEEMGHEVIAVAKSGDKAIAYALELVPELILMDIKIEGDIDGIETAEQIKNVMDCPIIFLTAYADDKTIQRAKLTEPYAYIVKPLDERELKSAIVIALYKNEIARKLKDSEIKYRTMINSMEGVVYMVDDEYNLIVNNDNAGALIHQDKANKKCYELLYNESRPCKHCSIDDLKKGSASRKEFMDAKNNKWNYMITTPVNLTEGKKYFQNLVIDITERKRNEESLFYMLQEKEIMLREIHHRVKNNLQLMLSLIRLQETNSSETAVKTNLSTIQNRLNSMALVHEDLYASSDLGRIPIRSYAEKLLLNLMRVYDTESNKIKIKSDIEELFFPVDIAIPLGIIVNELVTNSIKHAFPKGRNGKIDIKFKKCDKNYVLEVIDDGSGFEYNGNLKVNNGLGLQISNILCRQLGCKIDYYNESGSHYKLTLNSLTN